VPEKTLNDLWDAQPRYCGLVTEALMGVRAARMRPAGRDEVLAAPSGAGPSARETERWSRYMDAEFRIGSGSRVRDEPSSLMEDVIRAAEVARRSAR